jgi:hypothetical protein
MDTKSSKNVLVAKIVLGLLLFVIGLIGTINFFSSRTSIDTSASMIVMYIMLIVLVVLFVLTIFLKNPKWFIVAICAIPMLYLVITSIMSKTFSDFYFCIDLGLLAFAVLIAMKQDKFALLVGGGVITLGLLIQITTESITSGRCAFSYYASELFTGIAILVIGILTLALKNRKALGTLWYVPLAAWVLGSFVFCLMECNTYWGGDLFNFFYYVIFTMAGLGTVIPIATVGLYIAYNVK